MQSLNRVVKSRLLDILKEMGIIGENFTGRIAVNMNGGAICDIEKIEKIK